MKFSEAMKLLEEGKKVRCVDWEEGFYIFLDTKESMFFTEKEEIYQISGSDFLDKWEEYIEPETKKIEKLDIRDDTHIALLNPQNNEGALTTHINELRSENHKMAKKINELIERMNELCGEKQ